MNKIDRGCKDGIVILATGLGFLVGIFGTGLGGLSALFLPRASPEQQGKLVGFSGGVMTGIVIWDLIPEAFRLGPFYGFGGFLAGIFFVLILRNHLTGKDSEDINTRFTKTALLLGLGIAVHNLPEGVAVGTVFTEDPRSPLWRQLSVLMAIHNIPEGMAIATSLRLGKQPWSVVTAALMVTELPMVFGALLGGLLGHFSKTMSVSALGFAAGAMIILVAAELLPISGKISSFRSTATGFSFGLVTAWLLTVVIG